ncbi:MAG TPA: acyloxyacyl hydrolase [Caulobacteraceae bacterium]|jgi:hypothetical protein|nr:acyloxyacyl hydrolase [Caulobacteraceae bacterium]
MGFAVSRGARGAIASVAVCVLLSPAVARAGVVDELNAAVMSHDTSDLGRGKESHSADIQFEVDTIRPRALKFLGSPRLNAIVAVNTAGLTNFAAAGFTWDWPLWKRWRGKIDFGLSVNDGVVSAPPGPAGQMVREHRLLLGSKVLFREAATVEWRFGKKWGLEAQFEHLSNGGILGSNHNNQGINDAGLALAYHFN